MTPWGTTRASRQNLAYTTAWKRWEIVWSGASGTVNGDALTWINSGVPTKIMLPYHDAMTTGWIDAFCLAKYVSPEPTHGAWGSEDVLNTQAGSATNWSWKVPAVDGTEKVRSGSATDWSWVTFQEGGTSLTVPWGTATSWQWGP